MSERSAPRSAAPGSGARSILSLRAVRWFELDWHILAIAGALLALGIALVSAMAEADDAMDRPGVDFAGHVQKVLVTLPMLLVAVAVRPRWLRRHAFLPYGACLVLLLLLPWIGTVHNGARRWFHMPGVGFNLQPSELAKIGLILALARVLYRNRLGALGDWGPPLALALVPMALVAWQPDLGTALCFVPITLGMLYLAGARASVLLRFLACAALIGALAYEFQWGVKGYQLQRIDTWLQGFQSRDLIAEKNGAAFHSYHARVAIGNGGLTGTGMGQGAANRTGALPERDCDSAFAVLAEELGFTGTAVVVLLYALMIALLMGTASAIRDRFSRLAVGGIAMYFAAHLFIHAAVNMGLIPMTGITLPLFSTGGSSLLATFLALGLALGLASNREPSLDKDSFQA